MTSPEETIADLDAVVARDQGSVDIEARLRVAEALVGKGDALVGLGRYDEAVVYYECVVEQFDEADDPDIGKQVRIALAKKASVLLRLDRLDEAHAAYDELCARASKTPNPELSLARAQAMIAKALGQAGHHEEAIVAADAVLRRFADDPPEGRVESSATARSKNLPCVGL